MEMSELLAAASAAGSVSEMSPPLDKLEALVASGEVRDGSRGPRGSARRSRAAARGLGGCARAEGAAAAARAARLRGPVRRARRARA